MKYIKRIPQEKEEVTEKLIQDGWKILKEPSSFIAVIAVSMPISIILMFITFAYFGVIFPDRINLAYFGVIFLDRINRFNADGISIEFSINFKVIFPIVGILIYTFLHEMLHAVTIPHAVHSNKTFWGMNGCFGFVYSEEKIKKGRYLLVSVAPLFILSFVVPLICRIFNFYHWYLLLLCIINAGGACVDIFNIILIARQVPAGGTIVCNGRKTLFQ